MPTIPHCAIEKDLSIFGLEPKKHFCRHNRYVPTIAPESLISNFTHNLPLSGGVYSSLRHCQ